MYYERRGSVSRDLENSTFHLMNKCVLIQLQVQFHSEGVCLISVLFEESEEEGALV